MQIQVLTLPRIYDGIPAVIVYVGIPTYQTEEERRVILQKFRSNKRFLGEPLAYDWGYPHDHQCLDLPTIPTAPEDYRWRKTCLSLSSWEEIDDRVTAILEPLREITSTYNNLLASMPSVECRFIDL